MRTGTGRHTAGGGRRGQTGAAASVLDLAMCESVTESREAVNVLRSTERLELERLVGGRRWRGHIAGTVQ